MFCGEGAICTHVFSNRTCTYAVRTRTHPRTHHILTKHALLPTFQCIFIRILLVLGAFTDQKKLGMGMIAERATLSEVKGKLESLKRKKEEEEKGNDVEARWVYYVLKCVFYMYVGDMFAMCWSAWCVSVFCTRAEYKSP